MSWTPAQQKAIETKNKTLLISAAAGSGKTTVLIERIIRSITDKENPSDISRMLIVTFTRAAAGELRSRISVALSKALSENPTDKRLFKQLASLGSAHISTIDSFYGDVVRKNAQKLGIPSSLRIADESELSPIRRRIMDDVIEMGYKGLLPDIIMPRTDGKDGNFNAFAFLADSLSDMRNDSELYKIFTDLYDKLYSHPKSIGFLKDCAEMYASYTKADFFSTSLGSIIKDYVLMQMEYLEKILVKLIEGFSSSKEACAAYGSKFDHDLCFCRDIISEIKNGSFASVRDKFSNFSFEKLGSLKEQLKTKESIYATEIRDSKIKKTINKIKGDYFSSGCSDEELERYSTGSYQSCIVLYSVLSKFSELYSEEKLTKGICEFNDIKIWAYKLLVNEDGSKSQIAESISNDFDSIYIDEYQDVDLMQDMIFRAISKEDSRFMVGDVKQSIYAFRGAQPSLFMNYRNNFAEIDPSDTVLPCDDNCTIFMSNNFRCDENIIRFANSVCSYIFSLASESIKYTKQDDLCFSKAVSENAPKHKVEIVLIDKEKKSKKEDSESESKGEKEENSFENAEAAYIAKEISRLLAEEKKADGSAILPKDIAVLCRAEKTRSTVAKELDRCKIKHTGNAGGNIFENPYVSVTFSLIAAIDNPQRDIYLSAVLLSPIFSFTADEIITIRQNFKDCSIYDAITYYCKSDLPDADIDLQEKCASFIDVLNDLRELACALPADKVISHIFSRFGILSKAPNADTEKALIKLYENARSYEGDEFKGLYSYVNYVKDMIENGKAPINEESDSEDTVKLITIHKSKGLEFPVCFVAGCASEFNLKDSKGFLLYSSELGIAMDLADESGFGRIKTPFKRALARYVDTESIEEEMRVLYVALTRAKERLYITASTRYGSEKDLKTAELQHSFPCKASVLDGGNYISWILSSMYDNLDSDFAKLTIINDSELCEGEYASEEESISAEEKEIKADNLSCEEIYDEIKAKFDYKYPYAHISNLPAKLSVSKLSPTILDISEDVPMDDSSDTLDIELPSLAQIPEFMDTSSKKAPSAAEKGTATHTFLQFCDFNRVKAHGVKNEIARLCQEKFISDSVAMMINEKQIEAFFESDLFKELKVARKIYREQRFNILLPACEFTSDDGYKEEIKGEDLLVQGVMDIFFIDKDGKLILCDYKTDHLSKMEIENKRFAEAKLRKAHTRQLSYYALALESIFGKAPDKIYIYSLPLGDTVEIFQEKVRK